MDRSFQPLFRTAAAALFVAAAVPAADAQQVTGTVQVRPARDSIVIRRIEADKVKIDSIMVIMRALDGESPMSDQAVRLRRELEAISRELSVSVMGRSSGGGGQFVFSKAADLRAVEAMRLPGWIGINPGMAPFERSIDSSGHFIHYYRYPLIISVEPGSPAQRAGIAHGDTLVAYDGHDVVRSRVNLRELMVPDKRLNVTVRRDGEARDFTVVVAKTPDRIALRLASPGDMPMPAGPMPLDGRIRGRPASGSVVVSGVQGPAVPAERAMFVQVGPGGYVVDRTAFLNRGGMFGAALMTVGPELASVLKLDRTGVLVEQAAGDSPAFKAGMRVGDFVVSIAGQPVNTIADVQAVVMSRINERAVAVQLLRDKKPVVVNVKW